MRRWRNLRRHGRWLLVLTAVRVDGDDDVGLALAGTTTVSAGLAATRRARAVLVVRGATAAAAGFMMNLDAAAVGPVHTLECLSQTSTFGHRRVFAMLGLGQLFLGNLLALGNTKCLMQCARVLDGTCDPLAASLTTVL